MKLKRVREEACPVCQHYHDYLNGERCRECGHVTSVPLTPVSEPAANCSLPTEVIPGFLFVGTFDQASSIDLLRVLGITAILNTVPSSVAYHQSSFQYYTVSTVPPPFEECAAFLDKVNEANGKALIYCMTGASRGPAIAIFYLMTRKRLNLRMAYSTMKSKRPSMSLKALDRERLIEAEKGMFGAEALGLDGI